MNTEKIIQVIIVFVGLMFLSIASTQLDPSRDCLYGIDGTRYPQKYTQSCYDSHYTAANTMGLVALLCIAGFGYSVFSRKGFFGRSNHAGLPNFMVNLSQPRSDSPAPQTQPSDIQQELQKAADMLKGGLIDEEEYKELKKKIISKS